MMKKKHLNKKGFTLIELIVVLAILAVIAAIAVPTAFGAITEAEDAAASASIEGMAGAVRVSAQMANLNKNVISKVGDSDIKYANNTFSYRLPLSNPSEFDKHFLAALQGSGMQAPKTAYFHIYLSISPKTGDFSYTITYSPKGKTEIVKPYYVFNSEKSAVKIYR